MSHQRRNKRLTPTCAPITPSLHTCPNCIRLEALLLKKEAQIVAQARVLHWIRSLLKTSNQLGLVPSHLDRPAKRGKF